MVYWVTGNSYIGKTTFIKEQLKNPCNKGLFVGQELRKKYGEKFFINKDNPSAPRETDTEVKMMIGEFLCKNSDPYVRDLFIDGVPRKPEQLDWIKRETGEYWDNTILFLSLNSPRTIIETDPDKIILIEKRRVKEDELMNSITKEYLLGMHQKYCGIEAKFVEIRIGTPIAGWRHVIDLQPAIGAQTNLNYLFRMHEELDSQYVKRYGISSRDVANNFKGLQSTVSRIPYSHVSFLKDMLKRLSEEVQEAYDEIDTKFWDDKPINARKIRVELMDQFHFMLTIAMSLDVTPADFGRFYLEKRLVNMGRIRNGKIKGDDVHVGLTKN